MNLPSSDVRSRRIDFSGAHAGAVPALLHHQWLVTNGLGGYASGTIAGAVTWRYHGLLIAALPAPLGRVLMLNHLAESLCLPDGRVVQFGGLEPPQPDAEGPVWLREFRLENQMPFWRYEIHGVTLEKRILMPNRQNTVHVSYRLLTRADWEGRLELRPSLHFRPFEAPVSTPLTTDYEVRARGRRFEVDSHEGYPPLRIQLEADESWFVHEGGATREITYERDAARGYESRGRLWTPGYFAARLCPHEPVTLTASTEDWHVVEALDPEEAFLTERARSQRLLQIADPRTRDGIGPELVLAADQFIVSPMGRVRDAARARAAGDELRSIIAGYHWFTDWGRDTMISLEGLTLVTGRHDEAAWILRMFAHAMRDGLIPNLFPEGRSEGLYHTVDATLWLFHSLDRYVKATGDEETLRELLPALRTAVERHVSGTHFGIRVDPGDGLLRQGEEGYQLTWMDAKVGDWVVTPRRGKAVEVNALWYNALRLLEGWLRQTRGHERAADELAGHARRARDAFNQRFWNPATGGLFDVVDGEQGDDPAVRPNQILAISLAHPILARERWEPVVELVERELVTPVGLRSLSRDHKEFRPTYSGDLRARDAAYHQGTVWAWLIGPFLDAWLKVHEGDRVGARRFLDGFAAHLNEGCIGSISEIFDAEAPFTERGCIAQAWSVAEVLRCLVLTAERPNALPQNERARRVGAGS